VHEFGEINTAGGNGAGGSPEQAGNGSHHRKAQGTLLYDAVYLAASQVMNQETGRRR